MKPRIALSMIVRDAEETLARCLESARDAVDIMYVADTGSRDRTIGIAEGFGAIVSSFPWPDDFAVARNAALREVRADWVLSLDADEMLDREAAQSIRSLVRGAAAGYQVTIRNYLLSLNDRVWDRPALPNSSPTLKEASRFAAFVEHQNVRLFELRPDIYFVGRVHESVGPRIEQLRLPLGNADFVIHHFGLAADAEKRARKNQLYYELGLRKINENPRNAQAQFEIGLVELDNLNDPEAAVKHFRRACQIKPRFAEAWFFQGMALFRMDQFAMALSCFERAEKLGHATQLVAESEGDSLYNLARFPEAADSYRKALDRAASTPELESKLGLAMLRCGENYAGFEFLRRSLARNRAAGILHDRLVLGLVHCGHIEEAAQAAEDKCRNVLPQPSDILRAASLWAQAGANARAAALLEVGKQLFPDRLEFQNQGALCPRAEEMHRSGAPVHFSDTVPALK